MIVVADTSPINYLHQIGQVPLLEKLYRGVIVPSAVTAEMQHSVAPDAVRDWRDRRPGWLTAATLSTAEHAKLEFLGEGERQAIQLAMELEAALLLIDDVERRFTAESRNLKTTGLLGLLLDVGELGLIDPEKTFHQKIQPTSFYASSALKDGVCAACTRRPVCKLMGGHFAATVGLGNDPYEGHHDQAEDHQHARNIQVGQHGRLRMNLVVDAALRGGHGVCGTPAAGMALQQV